MTTETAVPEKSAAAGYAYGLVSAFLGGVFFCTGTYLVKPATGGVGVREFTLALYCWATLFAFFWMFVSHGRPAKMSVREHLTLLVLGALWGTSVGLAFHAAKLMNTASAATLFRTNVLFTLALSYLVLGERLTNRELGAAMLIVVGVVLLLSGGEASLTAGPLSAFGSALTASLYHLVVKKTLATIPAAVVTAFRNLYVCVVFFGFAVAGGWATPQASARAHGIIALAALIGPFLHSLATLKSIANLPLLHASLIAQTQPLFVLLLSGTFMSAIPRWLEVGADLLVLAGVMGLIAASQLKRSPG